jgi:hypothetical protein
MNMKNVILALIALTTAALLMPIAQVGVRAQAKTLVAIVGATNPLKDASTGLLRRAFQGEAAEYASGKRLIAINMPPANPLRQQFDKAVLGLKPEEIGRFWVDRRIRGESAPPKTVPSPELALRLVMSLPGAISYVTSDLLNEKVRALTIDGKAAGQPGYPLR